MVVNVEYFRNRDVESLHNIFVTRERQRIPELNTLFKMLINFMMPEYLSSKGVTGVFPSMFLFNFSSLFVVVNCVFDRALDFLSADA